MQFYNHEHTHLALKDFTSVATDKAEHKLYVYIQSDVVR